MRYLRRILLAFFLLCFWVDVANSREGTTVSAPVTVGDPANTFPVAYCDEIQGCPQSVADLTVRDAIEAERRLEGMTVHVISTGLTYRLVNGITNSDWQESSVAANPAGSLSELQYKSGSSFGAVPGSGVNLDGNVGLGTTSPNSKIAVVGDISLSGKISTGGSDEAIRGNTFRLDFNDYGDGTLLLESYTNSLNNQLVLDLEYEVGAVRFFSPSGANKYFFDDTVNDNATLATDKIYLGGIYPGTSFDVSSKIVSYYKMEGTTGTGVTDNQSVNSCTADADISGLTTTGKIGKGFKFIKADENFLDCGSSSTLKFPGDFTVMFWFRTTQTARARLMGNRSSLGAEVGWEIYINPTSTPNPGKIGANVDAGSTMIGFTANKQITLGLWYHVTLRRLGEDLTLWVNGVPDSLTEVLAGNTGTNAGNTYIGRSPIAEEYFEGWIDNVKFFDEGLSQAEIEADYNLGIGTEALSITYTSLDAQVIATSVLTATDFGLTTTKADLIVQGNTEVGKDLYLSEQMMYRDATGNTCTECFSQDGILGCSEDSNCLTDGTHDN